MSRTMPVLAAFLLSIAWLPVNGDLIDGEELADPTRPYGTIDESPASRSPTSRYSVQFIRAGGNAPVAVVNNQRVEVGDSVEGALVLEINRDYVTLAINGERTEVRLGDGVSKTRVDDL